MHVNYSSKRHINAVYTSSLSCARTDVYVSRNDHTCTAGNALIVALKNALATRISNKAILSGKLGGDFELQKEIELSEAIRIDNETSNVFALAYVSLYRCCIIVRYSNYNEGTVCDLVQ